jgi:urease alpha subunit
MGDPGASIPTRQTGSTRARCSVRLVARLGAHPSPFVSQLAKAKGSCEAYGLTKDIRSVERLPQVGKKDLKWNNATAEDHG